METIFDYNPTDEELDYLGIEERNKEDYLKNRWHTEFRKVLHLKLYFLHIKNDKEKAGYYSLLLRTKKLIPKMRYDF